MNAALLLLAYHGNATTVALCPMIGMPVARLNPRVDSVCTLARNIVQLYKVVVVLAIDRFVRTLHCFNQVRGDRNSANQEYRGGHP